MGDSKIPSILYYHQDGTVHSAGAEAAVPGIDLEAEDENLIFVKWSVQIRFVHLSFRFPFNDQPKFLQVQVTSSSQRYAARQP